MNDFMLEAAKHFCIATDRLLGTDLQKSIGISWGESNEILAIYKIYLGDFQRFLPPSMRLESGLEAYYNELHERIEQDLPVTEAP